MNKFEKYYKAVDFLEGLSNIPIAGDYMIDKNHAEGYLKRMRYFLNLLGNPDRDLRFIHIGGTAGKGTVTNTVHEILNVSGKKVGSFTSPFVTTTIEKIKVGDKYISPDDFADIVEYLKPYIDEAYINGPYGRPSYFELCFALALIYFQQQKCEFVVLEVGLGGRYDATNVIEKPVITAITNIDYDHTELLGKTLNKIAYDKAGIIKKGSVFFTTEQRPSLIKLFNEACKSKGVLLNQLKYQESYKDYNKALSAAVAKHLGIEDKVIARGIKKARLMARFEIMQDEPKVILDGAHNRSKMKTTIQNLKTLNFNRLHVIIGISENKDHISILEQIIPRADSVFFTRFQIKDRKCAHPKELFSISKRYLKKSALSEIYLDPDQALMHALKIAETGDTILITGTFFLAGEMRKHWIPEEVILKKRQPR